MSEQTRPIGLLMVSALLSLAVVAGLALGGGEDSAVAEATLVELRDGGDVLLFRHALTDRSMSDLDPTARGGCEQQRPLSAEGVEQATHVGDRLRALGVPLGEVYASPFCRTVDTAQAIAGSVEPTDALVSLTSALDSRGVNAITEAAAVLIDAQLDAADVTVMVTHTQNIEDLTGITVEEGDAVVLTRSPAGAIDVVDVIPAADW